MLASALMVLLAGKEREDARCCRWVQDTRRTVANPLPPMGMLRANLAGRKNL